ncbi:MAG: dihydrolipoyllysine-residue acetyltransferase [Pseudomonadales bacterium]|nr:dihydrolipoyllysine-residue acetyltransferase [Pseudomonadales bacterium]
MAVEKIQVPDLGESTEVEVIEILVKPGDEVSENDSLIVLESDKAAMEIPAPKAGVVKDILLKVGDQVSQGQDILELELAEGTATAEPAPATKPAAKEAKQENPAPAAKPESEPEAATPAPAEAPAAQEAGAVSIQQVRVPDLGGATDVDVIDVLVAVGDEIKQEDGLVTLETDKAAMDVPSPAAGKVKAIELKVGDKVSEGALVLELETTAAPMAKPSAPVAAAAAAAGSETATTTSAPAKPAAATTTPETTATATAAAGLDEVYAGPAVRKLARELGVDLRQVTGTGIKNRIQKDDVHAFVKARLQQAPAGGGALAVPAMEDIDFSRFGEIEMLDMSKLQRVTAQNMQRAWLTVPHVTQFDEVDVTDLEDFRAAQKALAEKKGVKLTPLPFIIKACAQALAEYPQFNVSLHSSLQQIIRKKYIHIGVAVATPAGLMVPVIRDVDKKSIWDIAREVAELGAKARERKLSRELMEGACFTVSSLGGLGGTGFTPIVNSPEVAILGVSRTDVRPVYRKGELVPRKIMPYSLSYDHRAVNGMDGGLFCNYLSSLLSDIRLMVL